MKQKILLAGLVHALLNVTPSFACDICALYNVSVSKALGAGSVYAATGYQLNIQEDVQLDGNEVESFGQELNGSAVQLVLGYQVTEKLGLQLNTPFIFRHYKRLPHSHGSDGMHEDHDSEDPAESHDAGHLHHATAQPMDLETGNEDGLGDISALATLKLLNRRGPDWFVAVKLLAGLKLPTGDTSRLEEEQSGESSATHLSAHLSAVHGHDLALGSGSFDFPLILNAIAQRGSFFAGTNLQYMFRTQGDYGYRYADDFLWRISGGYRHFIGEDDSVALHAVLSGEIKDKDEQDGRPIADTGLTSMFLGPEIEILFGDLSVEVAFELPLLMDNTGLQSVTTQRWRAGVTYRF